MSTEIRTDTSAHTIADLASGYARDLSPLHLSSVVGAPGEVQCSDGRTVIVAAAQGSMGSTLPGSWVLSVCDSSGPVESYDLDARGLVRRRPALA